MPPDSLKWCSGVVRCKSWTWVCELKFNMCKMYASDAPAEISHAPEDAKEIAKKLIASGVCIQDCH